MSTKFKEGDRVQIVDREANAEDAKSGLFFPHFRGLTGAIQKIYPTEEVAVEIEPESLTETVAQRHLDVQEQMKIRWLDGLSEEARNRLNEKELDFQLRYTVLVALGDLTTPGKNAVVAPRREEPRPQPAAAAPPVKQAATGEAPPRRTLAELEAAEAAEIERRLHGDER